MLFEMLATEITHTAEEADVVVSDSAPAAREGAQVIRSCDFEKIVALLHQ